MFWRPGRLSTRSRVCLVCFVLYASTRKYALKAECNSAPASNIRVPSPLSHITPHTLVLLEIAQMFFSFMLFNAFHYSKLFLVLEINPPIPPLPPRQASHPPQRLHRRGVPAARGQGVRGGLRASYRSCSRAGPSRLPHRRLPRAGHGTPRRGMRFAHITETNRFLWVCFCLCFVYFQVFVGRE